MPLLEIVILLFLLSEDQFACISPRHSTLTEQLGRHAHQSTLRTTLALKVHLHGHLTSLLDGALLAGAVADLACSGLVVEELKAQLASCEVTHNGKKYALLKNLGGLAYLASLGHGHAQECSLSIARTSAVVGLVELLQGLHGGSGAQGVGVALPVIVVRVIVLLYGIYGRDSGISYVTAEASTCIIKVHAQ